MRPLAADVFADGVYRMSREHALQRAHIEFNTATRLSWLVFDSDDEQSFESWAQAALPAPNFYAQNAGNGHGHLAYCLKAPVGLLGLSRLAPIELASDVQRGMTRRLRADPAYANRLGKNPLSDRWRTSWLVPEPYELRELLEPLGRHDLRRPANRSEITGVGRNCDLFHELRECSYTEVLRFKRTGAGCEAWATHLLGHARGINLGFPVPLSFAEIRQIAKSVARWTWTKFSDQRFSRIQAARGARGGTKSGKSRARSADAAAEEIACLLAGQVGSRGFIS
jgi:Replicase family